MKFYLLIFLMLGSQLFCAQIYSSKQGEISFVSEAPLEIIKAHSNNLEGILDLSKMTFAFRLYIKSFDGFNNSLQKIHFYENYMETAIYPTATFSGKIIDDIKTDQTGRYRAKGIFDIHGVKNELIVNVKLTPQGNSWVFSSEFQIALADHNIQLPRIVYQKIAEIIQVRVNGVLEPKP